MKVEKARPTVDELYALLKKSSIPTVLVEGKDDIVFYRRMEDDLQDIGIDMLPVGNKGAVIALKKLISENPFSTPVAFIVDKDLWVYYGPSDDISGIITTDGYSIENDIFIDGDLKRLLDHNELKVFEGELRKFIRWYALMVDRSKDGLSASYRTHPGKVLDDFGIYESSLALGADEVYPEHFYDEILKEYGRLLRGKSLFALLVRQLSAKKRSTKFSVNQLMEIGASNKGGNYQDLCNKIRAVFV